MNKFLKTLTVVAVLIMIIACMGTLVACGDNSGNDVKPDNGGDVNNDNGGSEAEEYVYKFTVLDADGNAVSGAYVKLCEDTNCKMPKATDANGVVIFTDDDYVSAAVYDIHVLMSLDYGAQEHDLGKTSLDQKDYTLTLPAEA